MKCPLCYQPIHAGADYCPHCDAEATSLNALYSDKDTNIRLLYDRAGILRVKERRLAENWIRKFSKEFPTCFLTIHLVDLNDEQSVKSYGIWALNTPNYADIPESALSDSGLCLSLDVRKKEVSLNYGYQLEPYLSAELCFNALTSAHPYLIDNSYMEALELMRHHIRKLMQQQSRKSKSILKRKGWLDRIIS